MHAPTTATAMTLSLLATVLAGCSAQTPAAPQVANPSAPVAASPVNQTPAPPATPPVSPGAATAPASPDNSACVTPQESLKLGAYLSVFNGKNDPNAIRLAPGYTVPIRQADGAYTMMFVMAGKADGFRVSVASDTWQFMPNSGAMRPDPDTLIYEFAVGPSYGVPKSGTITIRFENLPGGQTVAPMTLRVFGRNDKIPACDVPTAYPAPSAVPKK